MLLALVESPAGAIRRKPGRVAVGNLGQNSDRRPGSMRLWITHSSSVELGTTSTYQVCRAIHPSEGGRNTSCAARGVLGLRTENPVDHHTVQGTCHAEPRRRVARAFTVLISFGQSMPQVVLMSSLRWVAGTAS